MTTDAEALRRLRESVSPTSPLVDEPSLTTPSGETDSCCYCGQPIHLGDPFWRHGTDYVCIDCGHVKGGQGRSEDDVHQSALWLGLCIAIAVVVVLGGMIWAAFKAGGAL